MHDIAAMILCASIIKKVYQNKFNCVCRFPFCWPEPPDTLSGTKLLA